MINLRPDGWSGCVLRPIWDFFFILFFLPSSLEGQIRTAFTGIIWCRFGRSDAISDIFVLLVFIQSSISRGMWLFLFLSECGCRFWRLRPERDIIWYFTQLLFRVGSFDVDDIFLNTLGGLIGFILYRFLNRSEEKKSEKKTERK